MVSMQGGHIGKTCQEREKLGLLRRNMVNMKLILNSYIQREAWTIEEEHALINAHRDGNRWAEIAKVLPRTNRVLLFVLRFFSPIAKVKDDEAKWIIGVTRYTKSSVI
ncbi:unnamed protein product [Triticum turgidum subsp. durum]|uniref:Myb-like domain-containing protein n=1 Tax=Triticum turgidum subsp. durum TaxID=4567 RepID=A0A9R0QR42_TRITD|nr:unnamed protein product [Triticum turgidum subsp. durum]